ncbi:MAG TPA: trypsin-like peptidase domain-containing protein [Baekduia sp.]|uniref:S1C family serine protease n=1 Tax=Baekduia sp. TaxID=2600305 RepID=UPI002CBDE652|nr:trypsin-like peptidase domain-containing protein [Baekduia sp.]HMJ37602.1 trypsin-like peptidase domain-containing protein [Baekduia sp.]
MRTLLLLLVLAAATVAVAGCGGGTTTQTVTADSGSAPAGANAADSLETQFIDVVRQRAPSVVQIETTDGLGSGVAYDDKGNIVTNAHVVGTAKTFTVTLAKGDTHKATLVGSYPPSDLAVIHLESGTVAPAPLADSSKLAVGKVVLAIGNPLGLRSSVTDGIISSLGRTVSEGGGAVIASAVQTSASINPGNSGGALVDLDGNVVGIPTLAATDPQLGGGQAPGIGFAIPSDTVRNIADQLVKNGRVTNSGRAYLGVEIASTLQGTGVVVAAVTKGGPADKAGVRAGDVILKVAGKPTPTADDLATVLATLKPGQTVPVEVRRADGSTKTLDVKLGQNPGT